MWMLCEVMMQSPIQELTDAFHSKAFEKYLLHYDFTAAFVIIIIIIKNFPSVRCASVAKVVCRDTEVPGTKTLPLKTYFVTCTLSY
jgi:hypothetical protein